MFASTIALIGTLPVCVSISKAVNESEGWATFNVKDVAVGSCVQVAHEETRPELPSYRMGTMPRVATINTVGLLLGD